MSTGLIERLNKLSELMCEAVKMHIMLGDTSRVETLATALEWRYGIGHYEAKEIVGQALALIDLMPGDGR